MTIAWPADLPQDVLRNGYDEKPAALALRTPMDVGPAKVRRRFTGGVRPLTVQLALTRAQIEVLDQFYTAALAGGVLAFELTHPRTRQPVRVRFVAGAQDPGCSWHPVSAEDWRAVLKLEVLP